jgi:hypothetical protein
MPYYSVTVEILVESNSEAEARDTIENYVDDLVSNKKNKDLQDYYIVSGEELKDGEGILVH